VTIVKNNVNQIDGAFCSEFALSLLAYFAQFFNEDFPSLRWILSTPLSPSNKIITYHIKKNSSAPVNRHKIHKTGKFRNNPM
jgi:hypothetical protein